LDTHGTVNTWRTGYTRQAGKACGTLSARFTARSRGAGRALRSDLALRSSVACVAFVAFFARHTERAWRIGRRGDRDDELHTSSAVECIAHVHHVAAGRDADRQRGGQPRAVCVSKLDIGQLLPGEVNLRVARKPSANNDEGCVADDFDADRRIQQWGFGVSGGNDELFRSAALLCKHSGREEREESGENEDTGGMNRKS
jgi:hypothetical protein